MMMVMIEMIRWIERVGLLENETFVIWAGKSRLRKEMASMKS